MLASGLFNTFVSIRLDIEGYSTEVIGLLTSVFYAGILVGSLKIDRWIAKVGHTYAFIVLAGISTASVLMQALWINPWYWACFRFIGGICLSGIFIVVESWLLMQSGPQKRGAALSIYLAVFYAALSGGQLLIKISDPLTLSPFCIAAALSALSILPLTFKKSGAPKLEKHDALTPVQLFKASPFGFVGSVVSGAILGTIYGLIPVYAKDMGMSISEIGTMMAVVVFGGLSLQWPLGFWGDKGNRRRALYTASFLSALFAIGITLTPISSPFLLILAWFFGGFSFTIYPLSMAYACQKFQESEIVAATGGFVLSYSIGAVVGPFLASIAMGNFGHLSLFYFLAAVSLVLGVIGALGKEAAVESEKEEI
jgi:MFS family permease